MNTEYDLDNEDIDNEDIDNEDIEYEDVLEDGEDGFELSDEVYEAETYVDEDGEEYLEDEDGDLVPVEDTDFIPIEALEEDYDPEGNLQEKKSFFKRAVSKVTKSVKKYDREGRKSQRGWDRGKKKVAKVGKKIYRAIKKDPVGKKLDKWDRTDWKRAKKVGKFLKHPWKSTKKAFKGKKKRVKKAAPEGDVQESETYMDSVSHENPSIDLTYFVQLALSGKAAEARDAFVSAMSDKVVGVIDAKRVQVAEELFNSYEDEDEDDYEEIEIDEDDEGEEYDTYVDEDGNEYVEDEDGDLVAVDDTDLISEEDFFNLSEGYDPEDLLQEKKNFFKRQGKKIMKSVKKHNREDRKSQRGWDRGKKKVAKFGKKVFKKVRKAAKSKSLSWRPGGKRLLKKNAIYRSGPAKWVRKQGRKIGKKLGLVKSKPRQKRKPKAAEPASEPTSES